MTRTTRSARTDPPAGTPPEPGTPSASPTPTATPHSTSAQDLASTLLRPLRQVTATGVHVAVVLAGRTGLRGLVRRSHRALEETVRDGVTTLGRTFDRFGRSAAHAPPQPAEPAPPCPTQPAWPMQDNAMRHAIDVTPPDYTEPPAGWVDASAPPPYASATPARHSLDAAQGLWPGLGDEPDFGLRSMPMGREYANSDSSSVRSDRTPPIPDSRHAEPTPWPPEKPG